MLEIEHPLTGAKLQVANKDFSRKMKSGDAIKACEKLGSGWRLPTMEELQAMYEQLHKKGQGSFHSAGYYSSTKVGFLTAYNLNFDGGCVNWGNKYATKYVRAVRSF
jgi:hypothetical protein